MDEQDQEKLTYPPFEHFGQQSTRRHDGHGQEAKSFLSGKISGGTEHNESLGMEPIRAMQM